MWDYYKTYSKTNIWIIRLDWYKKIGFDNLSENPNAIELLEENPDKINWIYLSENPSIFELDYAKMRENNQDMYEDLIKEVMKPSRVFKDPNYNYLY